MSKLTIDGRPVAVNPVFGQPDRVVPAPWIGFGVPGPLGPASFAVSGADPDRVNPISRASPTPARVAAARRAAGQGGRDG